MPHPGVSLSKMAESASPDRSPNPLTLYPLARLQNEQADRILERNPQRTASVYGAPVPDVQWPWTDIFLNIEKVERVALQNIRFERTRHRTHWNHFAALNLSYSR